MGKRFYTKATRDFSRIVRLGPLTTVTLGTGQINEIAPARDAVFHTKAGEVQTFTSAKKRDAYIAAIETQNPGAVIAIPNKEPEP